MDEAPRTVGNRVDVGQIQRADEGRGHRRLGRSASYATASPSCRLRGRASSLPPTWNAAGSSGSLHDGAQQHLVALAVKVQLARTRRLRSGGRRRRWGARARRTRNARERESSSPSGSTRPFTRSRTRRKPRAAAREPGSRRRSSGAVQPVLAGLEATAYFCCLEALRNAADHAGDGARATVLRPAGGEDARLRGRRHGNELRWERGPWVAGCAAISDRLGAPSRQVDSQLRAGSRHPGLGRDPPRTVIVRVVVLRRPDTVPPSRPLGSRRLRGLRARRRGEVGRGRPRARRSPGARPRADGHQDGGHRGIAAARSITAVHPGTVTVLVSTYRAEDLPVEAHFCGAAAYLHKSELGGDALQSLWRDRRSPDSAR